MKIDKNIPIPRLRYPFKYMEIGDSVLIKDKILNARGAANHAAKSYNMKFKTATMTCGGLRVWRIA